MEKTERTIYSNFKGKERMEGVLKQIYTLIPPWMKFFIPESTMREKLQKWFNLAKDYLDDGKINSSN
jgi:hypothetical protein